MYKYSYISVLYIIIPYQSGKEKYIFAQRVPKYRHALRGFLYLSTCRQISVRYRYNGTYAEKSAKSVSYSSGPGGSGSNQTVFPNTMRLALYQP